MSARRRYRWNVPLGSLAAAALVAAFSTGCTSATSWRPLRTVPEDAVVLPVTGRIQQGNRCGPNALAILLAASGTPIEEPVIAKAVQIDRLDGALNIDLLLFARAQGYSAQFETGSVERLVQRIEEGLPALLMMKLERRSRWFFPRELVWHFMVVYGVSRTDRVFLAHSGWGPRRVKFEELDESWARAGRWMMHLAKPLDRLSIATSQRGTVGDKNGK
ncbi:MAG TPA: hypothetical protein VEC39_20425 [Vicinamibacterales bacterium]|nr:hypothetical protein [Vicinamibacterales bacterium]